MMNIFKLFSRGEPQTEEELREWLTEENLKWWRQQQATQADHERLSEDVRKALEEGRKGKK